MHKSLTAEGNATQLPLNMQVKIGNTLQVLWKLQLLFTLFGGHDTFKVCR